MKQILVAENVPDSDCSMISETLTLREELRLKKDFREADKLRQKLNLLGYRIEDEKDRILVIHK